MPSNNNEKLLYLTFDDGPHPIATNFVLNCLQKYNAKATFFCIGKNVIENKELFQKIITQQHTVANHTHNHLNGYKSNDDLYINNILEANKIIPTKLFRPPYGRITKFQIKLLNDLGFKIIMWNVLSGDFDIKSSKEDCLSKVILNTTNNNIIVFHDSEKAFDKVQYTLPKILEYYSNQGYKFKAIQF